MFALYLLYFDHQVYLFVFENNKRKLLHSKTKKYPNSQKTANGVLTQKRKNKIIKIMPYS